MKDDISWDLYRSFYSVMRAGTLSGAAKALGITQPTVGRHIDLLEATLGYPLFIRSQTGFLPTEAGIRLMPYLEALSSMTAALVREASNENDKNLGTVRISASEIMGNEVLPPIMSDLMRKYPSLQIELNLSNEVENILNREADIAVRMTVPEQKALIAKKIGVINVGFYAHQKYLAQKSYPKTFADLRNHTLIGFDVEDEFIRDFRTSLGGLKREHFAFRTNNQIAQLTAICAGIGIGICHASLAKRNPDLVPVLPKLFQYKMSTFLVMHENLKSSLRCKLVYAALSAGLSNYING